MVRAPLELSNPTEPGQVSRLRFLLTNGLGGYALTTPAQTRSSAAHGLLACSPSPTDKRFLLLARVDEALILPDGQRLELDTHYYRGSISPDGFRRVTRVGLDPFPVTRFQLADRVLERTFFMLPGHSAIGLRYTLLEGADAALELRPQLAFREVHALVRADQNLSPIVEVEGGVTVMQPSRGLPPLYWGISPASRLEPPSHWYYQVRYPDDEAAGQPGEEDLWSPGKVYVPLRGRGAENDAAQEAGASTGSALKRSKATGGSVADRSVTDRSVTVVAGLDPELAARPEGMWLEALEYRRALCEKAGRLGEGAEGRALLVAADAFLIRRGEGWTVATRYPSGEERFREAMIALPGLTLVSERFGVARAVLQHFAFHHLAGPQLEGPHAGHHPVTSAGRSAALQGDLEAPAWFLYALDRYLKATDDRALAESLWPSILAVIEGLEWTAPGPDQDHAELDAVWANGWTAAARLAERLGRLELAAAWQARALRIRRHYRARPIPVPDPRTPLTRAQVLSVSLPYPLYAGQAGWGRIGQLTDPAVQLGSLPIELWGEVVMALHRQRLASGEALRRWIAPAIDHLLGPGLGHLPDRIGPGTDHPSFSASSIAGLASAWALCVG